MKPLRRTLAACGLIAAAVGLLGGCEEGPGASPDKLNPPSWIHGTWVYCTPVPGVETAWTFSAHNAVYRFGATSTDYSETSASIQDSHGDTWYRFETTSPDGRGGTITAANRFARDGAARINWTSTISGFSTTVRLCRQ